ncbi:MAG: Hpt domain-containing protein [Bacteroidota bacterium]|nr:Hpt domain-containing protein [Bacteroidota bacterium]
MSSRIYSLDYLNSISGGDAGFISDMVSTFIENTPEELSQIRTFVDSGNWPKAGAAAHRFSSSLLFLGLDALKQLSTEIEDSSLQGVNLVKIPELLAQLENGCNQAITELKADFNV